MTLLKRMLKKVVIFLYVIALVTPGLWSKDKETNSANSAQKLETKLPSAAALPILSLEIKRADEPPIINGKLNDPIWQKPALPLGEWRTYNPLYGAHIAQQTQVWAAYDKDSLYFAFHCTDPEPEKIKSAISRRDTIWNDDWIGLSLDSLGSHQSSYEFFVNPNGVQGDMLNNTTSGESSSPDWIWESASQKTDDGYIVEIRIPFKSIRFSSGSLVKMEVLFWRRISRLGISASWPDLPPGKSFYTRHAPLILHDVKQPVIMELIPNLTYSLNQKLSTPGQWSSKSIPDGGITAKFGITSSTTLDGTYRPDFSQVESDSFQIEVNQRYPTFYSEKRPFFMEGMGTFELAGTGGDANMTAAVHTRRIANPLFGIKLAGTVGKLTFASLSTTDRSPTDIDESGRGYEGKKYFQIGRMLYSLGKGTYVGGLIADSELASGHNRVLAGDLSLRMGDHQQITGTVITTNTEDPGGAGTKNGMAGQLYYAYRSKRQIFLTQFEHYDKDFQMDTAFYNRTGITTNWTYYSYNLYPDEKRYPWFKKFSPFIWVRTGRDRIQGGDEHYLLGGIQANFIRQGFLRMDIGRGTEPWAGREFETERFRIMGSAQIYRWLNFSGQLNAARSIYYDKENPFSGHEKRFYFSSTIQPNDKLSQSISYSRTVFKRASNNDPVFTAYVINSKTTYQFDKHFSLRAIGRYDSSQKRMLLDYLASFELIPGTVAYAGYGLSFDKQNWDGTQYICGQGNYENNRRGLFFKVSYLYRF
jgi:hypothetical protein